MFIEVVNEKHVKLRCDVCNKEFVKYRSQIRDLCGYHFCPNVGSGRKSGGSNCRKIAQSTFLKEKICKIIYEKYGVVSPGAIPDIRRKICKTFIERWVLNKKQARDLQSRREKTCLIRYGVSNVFQRADVKKNCSSQISRKKAFETKKQNGNLWKSKPEDDLYEVLCAKFGVENVERQKWIKKWPIDFYVITHDTYVQYDSYWHGYDNNGRLRNINDVMNSTSSCDKEIYKKMLTDIEQNDYFIKNNLRLVRYIGTKLGRIDTEKLFKQLCID